MVADFTNYHSFFWHDLGGIPGVTGNPIVNPQTGGFGYETDNGVFHEGPADIKLRSLHKNIPNGYKFPSAWRNVKYPSNAFAQPIQPKCGSPDEANKDPGKTNDSYGTYTPAIASQYSAPNIQKLVRQNLLFL
ncbi:hypothetical protein O181_031849 [Austropuccinia psidii MF-1]|uniref:Uncharacterized protein n=1 Tax=Austropuccinia psidii MF-1 TaxID=1389203 RepID=A0A9Q3CVQ1_9BASI|nr:hypothetical protein [Austropuccinia psidii MF-1]